MTPKIRRQLLLLAIAASVNPLASFASDDRHAIIHRMMALFDLPDNLLSVNPVVIQGNNAIAGWIQGEKGGRTLLWCTAGQWQIRLCSGDGLKDQSLLEIAHISPSAAESLLAEFNAAEFRFDPAVASFEGTMMIETGGGHQGHAHGRQSSG